MDIAKLITMPLLFLLVYTTIAACQYISQCERDNCRCCANMLCSNKGFCTSGCKAEYPECVVVSVVDEKCGLPDCICCATNSCPSSGVCSGGCKPGYHGGRCKNKCPENCISCRDHPDVRQNQNLSGIGYCTVCKDGHYLTDNLYQCQSTCSAGCKTCTSKSNCTSCMSDLVQDLQNPGTCFSCNYGCKTCISRFNCTLCMAGFYPDLQNSGSCVKCPNICKSCNETIQCTSCKAGYFHILSDGIGRCIQCPDGCLTCESHTKCSTCTNDRFGEKCDKICSNGCNVSCKKDTGHCECKKNFEGKSCDTCTNGTYGISCSEKCSNKCSDAHCERFSGNCYACTVNRELPTCENCSKGKYGKDCDMSCPKNCMNNTCEQSTGKCSFGCSDNFDGENCSHCIAGKFGNDCQQNCSKHCNDSLCNQESGECFSCEPNFMGKTCNQCKAGKYNANCSYDCPINCSNSGCERNNGDCYACLFNRTYGRKCNTSCPSNCINETCTQELGACDSGCKPGYSGEYCGDCEVGKYGTSCENNCSLNCQDRTCNRSSGDCMACLNNNFTMPKCENCTAGLYGMHCNLSCSNNCNGSVCEKDTGTCSSGCVGYFSGASCDKCIDGKFGKNCTDGCPERCLDKVCNMTNGYCSGCIKNFTGDTCDECFDGLYGDECDQICPPYCKNITCDRNTGDCVQGCSEGFSGDKCCLNNSFCNECSSYDECDNCTDGKHGQTCEDSCPLNCRHRSCHRLDGSCNGCKDGFQGLLCADAIYQPGKEETNIAAPVAGTLTGIAGLALTVVIIVLYLRRRYTGVKGNNSEFETEERIYENENIPVSDHPDSRKTGSNENRINRTEQTQSVQNRMIQALSIPLNEVHCSTSGSQDENNYYNTPGQLSKKIHVSRFADHVKGQTSAYFNKEFQALPKGLLKPCNDARKPENIAKNRYNSIYPYDETRVKLVPPGSDFINACYIDGYKKEREYIASLGPIIKATEEFRTFWRMVWQEKTEKIVMVTNLMEKGGMKCEKYWPDLFATQSYGDIIVSCHDEEIFAEYTIRRLSVFKGDEKRPLYHIHYTAWPDKAVPDDVTSLIDFRQKVNAIKTTSNGPTVVHCSAGVGRTGTFIALDILTQEGETEGTVDVFERVSSMRHQRTYMVQTWEQYEYLHHALVHILAFDYRPIAAEDFEEYVSTCSDAVMSATFERLYSVAENVLESEVKAKKRNKLLKPLNREDADIPGDIGRPRLYEGKQIGENDYINAVYLNSFRQKDRYLLVMTPLPETVTDFLTLLIQEKVTCIVSLDDEKSHLKSTGTYLPFDNQAMKLGAFEVKSCLVTSNSCYIQRSCAVIMRKTTGLKSQTIHHFQTNLWPNGVPAPHDDEKFLQLIKEAEKATDDTKEKGTMVVHCLNAAERSCLFCAISIMLQKMDTDREVSVINTLRQVKARRSKAIPNKEQYVFCHKCICTHLQSGDSNLYTNLAIAV